MRFRIKFHMSKSQKLLFEVGVGILCMIVLLGVLGTLSYTSKTPILTTEDLWKHANTTLITFEFRNATDPSANGQMKTFRLADVASFYNEYLYISIPYPEGYEVLRGISIYNFTTRNGGVLTAGYMVEHGVNRIVLYVEPINSTPLSFRQSFYVSSLQLSLETNGNGYPWATGVNNGDTLLLDIVSDSAVSTADVATKWKALFPDNDTINRAVNIDVGSIAIKAAGHTDNVVGLFRFVGDVKNLEGLKLKLEIYAISEKPVLKTLTEPIYPIFAGIYSALLGVIRRVKSYVLSAFSGFSVGAIFTGLIGDPLVALIITLFSITVFFAVYKGRR